MIVSPSKGYVFVHIPKTAGTSVMRALEARLCWNDVMLEGGLGRDGFRERFGLWKHSPAAEVRAVIGEQMWAESFTFGFVRNPYDRMRSLYTFTDQLLREQGILRYLARIGRLRPARAPFSWDWVRAFLESDNFSDYIRNPRLLRDPVAQPMSDYLTADGEVIVDFVGRCESLDEDFARICARLGMPRSDLKKHNASEAAARLDHYYSGPEDYAWVYECFEQDFLNFGYDEAPSPAPT